MGVIFRLQLTLNLAWTPLFFGLHLPGVAFGEILVLLTAIIATFFVFLRINRIAALLLVPYLLWVIFAAVRLYPLRSLLLASLS